MRHLIALFLFTVSTSAFAQVRINNGGEGVWYSANEFYLLDIFEQGAALDAFVGKSVPSFAAGQTEDLWPGLDIDRNIFARKLGDLEVAYPGLGRAALMVAKSLSVRAKTATEELMPFYPQDAHLDYVYHRGMGVRYSTVAVRLGTWVVIDFDLYKHLPREHKVGLLLHEILFAFARLDCRWSNTWCSQFSPDVRKIVGRLFAPAKWNTDEIRALITTQLHIPNSRRYCGRSKTDDKFTVWRLRQRAFTAGLGMPGEPPIQQIQFRISREMHSNLPANAVREADICSRN